MRANGEHLRESEVTHDSLVPRIEFRDVSLTLGDEVVLNGVNFSVAPGEMKVVLGESGAGKSTIVKPALGLLQPEGGEIFIDVNRSRNCRNRS